MDYGYVNARVKGMHSRLLDKKSYDALLIRQDLPSVISELVKTPYKPEIEEASILYSGICVVDCALRKNLINTYQTILDLVENTAAELYLRIFLSRWDVQNIKTILRGKNIQTPTEDIFECLVPAGSLDEATLTELMKQPDVRAVIDLLATWEVPYALPLTGAVDEYSSNRELVTLEYALDQFHYQNALEKASVKTVEAEIIRNLIRVEIDTINIKSILRIIRDRIEPEDAAKLFLEGGMHIRREKFESLASMRTIEEAVRALEGTPYYFLSELPPAVITLGKISVFEKELDEYQIRNGVRLFRGDPLSLSVIIGYLWAKFCEVINLRIIARCKYAGVSDEDLEKELIHV